MASLLETIGTIAMFVLLLLAYVYLQNIAEESGKEQEVRRMETSVQILIGIVCLIALLIGLAVLGELMSASG